MTWLARCVLYGLQSDAEVHACSALLRGIAALYGDGFSFQMKGVDDIAALHRLTEPFVLTSGAVAPRQRHGSPVAHIICRSGEIQDEIVAVGLDRMAVALRAIVERQLQGSDRILGRKSTPRPPPAASAESPVKIFVSGDRSQVGKSTVCLGLVGSLLRIGFRADEIAYIKPATQCEQPQLIAKFCRQHGIECCDIGPIVFYSGFTREFLAGNTESSGELLAKARAKVDEVGQGKKVVVVDGVGYPAVGSICGVSNASVARVVQAPVVLVGKKGVGDAVDSFNLNSCFFESQGVPVLGAIFNRLPSDGFYSLENCRKSVLRYFDQFQPTKRVYGFIPEVFESTPDGAMSVDGTARTVPSEHISFDELGRANQVISLFFENVNVKQLLEDATSYHHAHGFQGNSPSSLSQLNKRSLPKDSSVSSGVTRASATPIKKTRHEIQAAAKISGAAGG